MVADWIFMGTAADEASGVADGDTRHPHHPLGPPFAPRRPRFHRLAGGGASGARRRERRRGSTRPLSERPTSALRFFCWLVGVSAAAGAGSRRARRPVVPPCSSGSTGDRLRGAARQPAAARAARRAAAHEDAARRRLFVGRRRQPDLERPVLSAEVIRSATGVTASRTTTKARSTSRGRWRYRHPGLRRAIANVVLRPIFEATGDTCRRGRDVKIWQRRRPQGAPRRRDRGDALARPLRRLPRRAAARLGLDRAAARHRRRRRPARRPGRPRASGGRAAAAAPSRCAVRRDRRPWTLSPGIDALAAEVGQLGLDARPLAAGDRPARSEPARRALRARAGRAPPRRRRAGVVGACAAGPGLLRGPARAAD